MRVGLWILAVSAAAGLTLSAAGQGLGQGIAGARAAHPRQPFTAKLKTTSVQTLANGVTITSESTRTEALDSQGRRLLIVTRAATGEKPEQTFYDLTDTKAKTTIRWSVPGKVVTTQNMPFGSGCWSTSIAASTTTSAPDQPSDHGGAVTVATTATAPRIVASAGEDTGILAARKVEQRVKEDLGTQVIQGLEAQGTRWTTTKPAGAIGNDAPLVITEELWSAPQYGLVVRSVREDPQTGKNTMELTEFAAGEPDASLFQIPESYEVRTVQLHQVPCQQ